MFRLFPFWRCVFLSRGAQTNNSRFDCPENIFSSVSWVHYIQAMYSQEKCTIACVVFRKRNGASFFCDINERNYRDQRIKKKPWVTCTNYWQRILYMKGPTMRQRLERFFPLFVCLFTYLFLPSAFLVSFFSYFFWHLSTFFHPHFPIRIRYPQVSGPRFTDTPLDC